MNLDHLLQQLCLNPHCITQQDRMLSTINTIVAHDRAWQHGVTVYQAFVRAYQQNIHATKKMSVINYLKRVHTLASLHYGESVANRIFSPRLVLSKSPQRPRTKQSASAICPCPTPDSNAPSSVSSPSSSHRSSPCSQSSRHEDTWLAAQGLVALDPSLNKKQLDEKNADARIDEDTWPSAELPDANIPSRGKERLYDEAVHARIDALSFFDTLCGARRTLPSPEPMHPYADQ